MSEEQDSFILGMLGKSRDEIWRELKSRGIGFTRQLAVEYVVEKVADERRARTLVAERKAEREAYRKKMIEHSERTYHLIPAHVRQKLAKEAEERRIDVENGGPQRRAEEDERLRQEEYEERARRRKESLDRAFEDFKRELRMEWTEELLNAPFSLPDGTSILWGDATRKHHEIRVEMFQGQARTALEGGARHLAAIDYLDKKGAETLRQALV